MYLNVNIILESAMYVVHILIFNVLCFCPHKELKYGYNVTHLVEISCQHRQCRGCEVSEKGNMATAHDVIMSKFMSIAAFT